MSQMACGWLSRLSVGLAVALALGACGGGGGGTRADPPPQGPPPEPPPPPPPAPPPSPPVVQPPEPAYSHHLAWTNAAQAHEAGLDGAGIRIGVIDSGVQRNHPALAGRVVANLHYLDPRSNDLSVDDVHGHGTAVAQVIAGRPFGRWPGGLAPGAEIVSARIISDTPPEDDGSGQGNEISGPLGIGPIHDDLVAQGVRIINNSWGGLYWTDPAATAQIAAEYRPFVVERGGLVVFSAGNSGFEDPSDTAALPSQPGSGGSRPAADLERGWLAVAALAEGSDSQLAYYSNACGLAMDYCLSAPGTVVVTGTDDAPDAPSYWRWSGTSFAAPIVSGAAALVWEAFPYFDNDLVRQTLLGTATDIGAPGVDPVFGHGRLDVGAAVRGPERLDWGDVVADFDGLTSAWRNPITGDGGIVKRGDGRLVLTAPGDYRGDTRVEAGTLVVDGELANTRVLVGRDGTLTGRGGIGMQIHNSGTVAVDVDNALVARGDYVQAASGTLSVQVGSQLRVHGTATIEGGTLHVSGLAPGYVAQASETVLTALGGLEGRFDALSYAASLFLEAGLAYDYDLDEVILEIARLDVMAAAKRLPSVSPAGLAAARRLEQAFARIDAGGADAADDAVLALAGRFQALADERAAASALDSLSGESHALATSLAFDAIDIGRRALSARVERMGPGNAAGAWRQALGVSGQGTGIAGGGFHLDGWMIGRDHAPAPGLVSGFAFGEVRAEGRVGGNHDRSRGRQTAASVYLGRLGADGYALGQATSGRFDRDIERWLFDGPDARAGVHGTTSGGYASLAVEAGRHLHRGAWRLTPYLGADHVRMRSDGFEEWGSAFALRTADATLARTQATVGLRARRDWRGASLRAWSEWQQTLQAEGFALQASLAGIDSWSPLPLADAAKPGGLVGLGLGTWLGRAGRLELGVDQRFGPRGGDRMAHLRYLLAF